MKVKLVKVIWDDANSHTSWTELSEVDKECGLARILACGILIKHNKKVLQLGLLFGGQHYGDILTIPASCIKSVRVLETLDF